MTEAKTQPTTTRVADFLAAVPDATRRADAQALVALMTAATGQPPVMWGPSIIGFGAYQYRYDSGRQGEAPRVGFSPRKAELVLYLADGFAEREALLAQLGKHRQGKACVYIRRLADVNAVVLEQLIRASLHCTDTRYPPTAP